MVKDERCCEEVSVTGASRAVSVQHHGGTICTFSQGSELDFRRSGDVAERLGQGGDERARDFYHLLGTRGGGKSLVLPDVAADQR
jgi:hypothetical protein